MHEGDGELFQLVNKKSSIDWDEWSETTIILEHEPTTVDRQISHLTEDSNKTSTKPLIDRQISVDEFRRLLRDGVDETDTDFSKKRPVAETGNGGNKKGNFSNRPVFMIGLGLVVVTGACVYAWYRTRK